VRREPESVSDEADPEQRQAWFRSMWESGGDATETRLEQDSAANDDKADDDDLGDDFDDFNEGGDDDFGDFDEADDQEREDDDDDQATPLAQKPASSAVPPDILAGLVSSDFIHHLVQTR
jgi:hypothetical protein